MPVLVALVVVAAFAFNGDDVPATAGTRPLSVPGVLPEPIPEAASQTVASAAAGDGVVDSHATVAENSPSAAPTAPDADSDRVILGKRQTLIDVLKAEGVDRAEALRAAKAMKSEFDPRHLTPGQELTVAVGPAGEDGVRPLISVAFRPEFNRELVVSAGDDGFSTGWRPVPHKTTQVATVFRIKGSLYASAMAADVPRDVVLSAFRHLTYLFDFARHLRPGDRVSLVYESNYYPDSDETHPGRLLEASLDQGDRQVAIYRYRTADGYFGFYDADGVSIENALAGVPVRGGELSSLYGPRKHPVLGYTRMHRGLDFEAEKGAPVMAPMAGRLERVSRYGSFGRYIRIRHDNGLATAYAHLSAYADGLAAGQRVKKGQVIGYVGSSGLATSPNLHYEVLRNGDQVNPLKLDLPPRRKLGGDRLAAFESRRKRLDSLVARAAAEDGRYLARGEETAQ
ncbi:MAG: M23 family metallopeptidase [Ectothiorhodospiraceae bacterium]